MSDGELVFSTGKKVEKKKDKNNSKGYSQGKGPIKFRKERKGRGGKTVTVLYDIPLNQEDAKALMKELQSHLACRGSLKDSTIELSGDCQEKAKEFLKKKH